MYHRTAHTFENPLLLGLPLPVPVDARNVDLVDRLEGR